jgi:hypothetical protein
MLGTTLRVARALAVSVMAAVVVTAAPAGTSDYCWDRCDFAAPCDTECKVDENDWTTCLDWGDCDFCDYADPTCGNEVCETWHYCEWPGNCPEDCGVVEGSIDYGDDCTYGEGGCPANYECNLENRCVPVTPDPTPPGPALCVVRADCPNYPAEKCVNGRCVDNIYFPIIQ